jgi:aminocarboxymuconate-semialdehyde decarboxylase
MDGLVDIHSHLYPRWYIDALKRRTTPPRVVGDEGAERFVIFEGEQGRLMGDDHWDLQVKLRFMAAVGIAQSIVSLGNPWLDPFAGDEAMELVARANADFASFEDRTGGRIVGMGVLPQHDVRRAVETVESVAATPTLYGVANGCRLCGLELDDAALDPIWAALERTGLPLLLHPHYVVGRDALSGRGHAFPLALGFPFETTVAVSRLVFAGVLQRFPELKLVASHGGGTIPFLAGRLDAGWQADHGAHDGHLDAAPSEHLGKLFLDALVYHPGAVRATAALVGTTRMAFGTDHPFTIADPAANLRAIDSGFESELDRRAVMGDSAREFFRLPTVRDEPTALPAS